MPRPALLGCALLAACGGGSGGSAAQAGSGFQVVGINVAQGATWKINRAIVLTFNKDVDFATVNLNTVSIANLQGFGATGFFYQPEGAGGVDRTQVVFQPTCPTLEDFSDAGLHPFDEYRLVVHGSLHGTAVQSTDGDVLEDGETVLFHTPQSLDPNVLFADTVAGPPQVRVLAERPGVGEAIDPDTASTHVEIGGVRRFFGLDPVDQIGRLEPGLELPLNHYSLPENRVVFVLHLNQPVLATKANIDRLSLEYREQDGEWTRMAADVVLAANCTESGAVARIVPRGILPRESDLRVVVGSGFTDLTGDGTIADDASFANATIQAAGLPNPLFPEVGGPRADERLDLFDFGGPGPESLEDTTAVFPVPSATWGDGRLVASFAFGGTGGPGGDFDWHIQEATTLVLDTSSDVIFGGPGGAHTGSQAVVNGVVDVRDVYIPATSSLLIVGPNTCTILASGDVTVLGEISLRGSDNPGVYNIATANQPEPGALGHAGGGDGGTGSPLTTQSSPSGLPGNGAFNLAGGGGGGGETSYKFASVDDRRGSGGGGGRLGPDVYHDEDGKSWTPEVRVQRLLGMDVERGALGAKAALGAITHSDRAQGGAAGPSPFLDNTDANDFFGTLVTSSGDLISGEATEVLAGSGGGGGGDAVASDTFPNEPFTPSSDEKGAGGGGGGGGLRILAIGSITVGSDFGPGSISADGGNGGPGENIWARVGGGSGGGSGGHIVLSSAAEIVIHGRAETGEAWYGDDILSAHSPRAISAVGGQGGAGNDNHGGADLTGPTLWRCDRIPYDHFDGQDDVLPQGKFCWNAMPDHDDPDGGPVIGAGGDGGPGLIQLHVDDFADLRFPTLEAEFGGTYATGLDVTYVTAPPPVGWKEPGVAPDQLVPFFGRLSMAQSRWIPLGLARVDGAGGLTFVQVHGLGGVVPHGPGETVLHEPALVGPELVPEPSYTISLSAAGLGPEDARYRENPTLLRRASVRLEDTLDAGHFQLYSVASASYDGAHDRFDLALDPAGPDPGAFDPVGAAQAVLVPHSLRIVSNGILDAYADGSDVTVLYDATVEDPAGDGPSEALSYSAMHGDLTEDTDDLNLEHWDYLRFRAIFDLDADGDGVDLKMPRPGLDSLRVQFEF